MAPRAAPAPAVTSLDPPPSLSTPRRSTDSRSVGPPVHQTAFPTLRAPPSSAPADTLSTPRTVPRFAAGSARWLGDASHCAAPAAPADAPHGASTTHAQKRRTVRLHR